MGIVMKPFIFALCAVVAIGGENAQADSWQPAQGHTHVPKWPGAVPDPHPVAGSEVATTVEDREFVAGRPWVYVERVSQPTMTDYSANANNTGAAVTYAEALDGALAWGWIDGQKGTLNDIWWLQRFTPRTAKSPWSKINRAKAEAPAHALFGDRSGNLFGE
jgi:hypothetical protein